MKKILYSSMAACMLVLSSCEKEYLEVQPTNAISDNVVFSTTKNAWGAINGMHRSMYFQWGNMDQAGQGGIMVHMDMLGEDIVMTASGNGWFNSTYQWNLHRNANASTVQFIYYMYYRLIANANNIIANIDNAEGPDADKQAIKGQALTYRAWAHYQLVQLYAERYDAAKTNEQLGVPLMTVATTEGQPRATVEEVYAQVNKDLDEAIALLPVTRNTKSHFNVNVAKGIKARVALTTQDWATAAKFAAEAREGFSLMSTTQYTSGFNAATSNPEWMWASIQQDDQQTYFHSFFAFMSANFNSTNIRQNPKAINSALYDKIAETDVRKGLWDPTGASIPVPPNGEKKPYANKKFLAKSNSLSVGDVPLMRAAEMYLIEAEAKARLGQEAEALTALNKLLEARFVGAKTEEGEIDETVEFEPLEATGQELIDEIMTQRRIELWGEGFRFLDLKRLNLPLDRTGANHNASLVGSNAMTKPEGSKEWLWLIPQGEINANKAMVQNPL